MNSRLDRARRLLADAEAASGLRAGTSPPGAGTGSELSDCTLDQDVRADTGRAGHRIGGARSGEDASARARTTGQGLRRSGAPPWSPGLRLVPDPSPDVPDDEPDPQEAARKIVLKRLAAAPRSRWELEQTLRRRGCDPSVAGAVLDRLVAAGLVDDVGFAEQFVRSRMATKGWARHALQRELRTRGVAPDIVDAALAEVSPGAELERARELAQRRVRTLHGLTKEVQTRRLAGYLTRKGYPADVVYAAVRDVVSTNPEHARD